jgi:hypothetical protein
MQNKRRTFRKTKTKTKTNKKTNKKTNQKTNQKQYGYGSFFSIPRTQQPTLSRDELDKLARELLAEGERIANIPPPRNPLTDPDRSRTSRSFNRGFTIELNQFHQLNDADYKEISRILRPNLLQNSSYKNKDWLKNILRNHPSFFGEI